MKYLLLILTLLSLCSCKNSFWYTDLYTRKSNRLKQVNRSYEKLEIVELGNFHLCYFYNPSGIVRREVGKLEIDPGQVADSALDSYRTNFNELVVKESDVSISNTKCLFDSKDSFVRFNQDSHSIPEKNHIRLYSQLSFTVESQRNLEGGGGMELTEDMGDDRHKLEYFLITALVQDDEIVYLDNRVHWTEVFSERGEQLKYEVPQIVIDSLVSLSLEEYFKRVKP
jgi:hypothetical protein